MFLRSRVFGFMKSFSKTFVKMEEVSLPGSKLSNLCVWLKIASKGDALRS